MQGSLGVERAADGIAGGDVVNGRAAADAAGGLVEGQGAVDKNGRADGPRAAAGCRSARCGRDGRREFSIVADSALGNIVDDAALRCAQSSADPYAAALGGAAGWP